VKSLPVDVLVPTCNRPDALAVMLTALGAQTAGPLRIVVSDQGDGAGAFAQPQVHAVLRYLAARGFVVEALRHLPRRGMAEQRAFLLAQARSPYCLFLDDDVILEADMVERLHGAIVRERCGFVGCGLHGLSYRGQVRPEQEGIEFWGGPVEPETVRPHSIAWARHHLHSAANLYHVQTRLGLTRKSERLYRVAWVGGCVLFDTAMLRECGGFDFWRELPPAHCGEDVLAQLRVMERHGGCGLIPSGAYHMELPTTVTTREIDAPRALLESGAGAGAATAAGAGAGAGTAAAAAVGCHAGAPGRGFEAAR
jgi:GT2 family glycosyltransferase